MDTEKQTRLNTAGYTSTTIQELFGLTDEENVLVEAQSAMDVIRLRLSKLIYDHRKDKLTQTQLSTLLRTSQPRIAMMESAHKSVTLDKMVRAALALGISRREIADSFKQSGQKTGARRPAKKMGRAHKGISTSSTHGNRKQPADAA